MADNTFAFHSTASAGNIDDIMDTSFEEHDEAVMSLTNTVLPDEEVMLEHEDETVDLTIREVMDLIESVVQQYPQLSKVRPYDQAINGISTAILKTMSISIDLDEVITSDDTVREFVYLLLNGYLNTRSMVDKGMSDSHIKVVYVPESSLQSDPAIINVSGKYVYKGVPVIHIYNKAVFDDIAYRAYGVGSEASVVDTIMNTDDDWKEIGVVSTVEFDIQTLTNLELATSIIEGSITCDMLKGFPEVRKKKIKQLITLIR